MYDLVLRKKLTQNEIDTLWSEYKKNQEFIRLFQKKNEEILVLLQKKYSEAQQIAENLIVEQSKSLIK